MCSVTLDPFSTIRFRFSFPSSCSGTDEDASDEELEESTRLKASLESDFVDTISKDKYGSSC